MIVVGILGMTVMGTSVYGAIVFDMLEIGNNFAPPDPATGRGSAGPFRIASAPVNNQQYAEFLNAVDPDGNNVLGLYNASMTADARGGINFIPGGGTGGKYSVKANMTDKPVNFVSMYDSMRFMNWMNNGQESGSTETGAYTMSPAGEAANTITRNAIGGFVLPTENEWYKSVFYDPRLEAAGGPTGDDFYWMYPNQSDTVPTPALVDATGVITNGPGVLNYNNSADWNGQDGNVSTIGSDGGFSYYGLQDTGGNVWEWNESISLSLFRGLGGGSYASVDPARTSSSELFLSLPSLESSIFGFRVAYRYATEQVPEPSTLAYVVLAGVMMQIRLRVLRERKAAKI